MNMERGVRFSPLADRDNVRRLGNGKPTLSRVRTDGVFDGELNRAQFLGRLACEQSGSANAGMAFRFEDETRGGHVPLDGVKFENERGPVEPGAIQRLPKFFAAGIQMMRRTLRKIRMRKSSTTPSRRTRRMADVRGRISERSAFWG